MSDDIHDIVIVGGGLAAATAADTLRASGYEQRLTIVTGEDHPPYERPPLSKQVLVGTAEPATTHVHAPAFYADHDIDLVTGEAATTIDRAGGTVTLTSGAVHRYDRLLLATGAEPRRLRLADRDLEGVVTLRTIDDACRLHDELEAADHVTIVGAGWIGCEVAAAARALDAEVTLVDPLDTPLQRVLGTEMGQVFADLHRAQGVDLRLGTSVADAEGTDRVERVTLGDGMTLATDLVVLGIGVVPRTGLAEAAGLDVDNGILTDQTLATSDPHVFAAGDVANAWHPRYGTHVRVEHWANARSQGQIAGGNLLGQGRVHDVLPYFFSDQYDLGMEYVGRTTDPDRVVVRGDVDGREFIAFWLDDDRVVATMNVNVWDVIDDLKTLVAAAEPVDVRRLTDPDVPLGQVTERTG